MRVAALGLVLAACAAPVDPTDFTLEDVNPASPSFGDETGPHDHLGKVSGWYFGHAT